MTERKVYPNIGNSKEYRIWQAMRFRCSDPEHKAWRFYGAKGITVCDEWKKSFAWFILDMGERPSPKHSLDRIDSSKNYCKENCRWATQKEQGVNKSSTKWIEFRGERLHASGWSSRVGGPRATIRDRLKWGWTLEEALTIPWKFGQRKAEMRKEKFVGDKR